MKATKWKGSPYVVAFFALAVANPMFRALGDDAPTGLKILMGVILLSIVVGGFVLSRHLANHFDEIGEARFDSVNRDER